MNWTLYNIRGPRAQVKDQIQGTTKVPEAARAFIIAQIDALPAECFAVSVNAYGQTHPVGNDVVSNNNITVSGMK